MSKLDNGWMAFLVELVALTMIFVGCFCAGWRWRRMSRKDPMEMRIHTLEQRIDMHELRLEKLERMVSGTNLNGGRQ